MLGATSTLFQSATLFLSAPAFVVSLLTPTFVLFLSEVTLVSFLSGLAVAFFLPEATLVAHLTDFVQEQCPAVGLNEMSPGGAGRASERAPLMPEQFRFDERLG